jgi:hypothetical protein
MAMRVKPDTGEVSLKQWYRVTNWSEYDRALVNRGNLTIWSDDASIRDSWTSPRPIGHGKPGLYSETVNGGQNPRQSGTAKKSGTEIAGSEPGQGRATALRSEPLTRWRDGYAEACL